MYIRLYIYISMYLKIYAYIHIYIMCIQPLKGMIQARPQIQDEGPLEHFGGGPPIYIYRCFKKHKPGAQYTLTTFFIFFLQRPCFNTSQTSQSRPGTPPATPAKLRFGIDSILLFSIELTDISARTKAGASYRSYGLGFSLSRDKLANGGK
jgi:hypothetical protein